MADPVAGLLEAIRTQFDLAMGRPEQVENDCRRLRLALPSPLTDADLDALLPLLPLLRQRAGSLPQALFGFFEPLIPDAPRPWPLLQGLLAAADPQLVRRALALAERLAAAGALSLDRAALHFLAQRVETESCLLAEPASMRVLQAVLAASLPAGAGNPPIDRLYATEPQGAIRRLAARLLDLDSQQVSMALAESLLGPEGFAFLHPYLEYTRASHLDLLELLPEPGSPPPCLASLRAAEALCGEELLREIIARLGWPALGLGMQVRRFQGTSLGGGFPLLLSPPEATLLEGCDTAVPVSELFLCLAHGGRAAESQDSPDADAHIARFRTYNINHALALAEILDIAPLSAERVHRLLALSDSIVQDFSALFSSHSEECSILPSVYRELKGRILDELGRESDAPQLSAELTRLVQMFEDPGSLGEVRTLHGLKRYLHQRGLRLGFRLVQAGRATNRTIDLLVASPRRVLRACCGIRYIDFESGTAAGGDAGPPPVPAAMLAEAFAFQLLHGQERFPSVRIFCYGNEVHYYLAYGNHPAFLRIDYSPPLLGGMIDLDYFGVSKSELSLHPDPTLPAIGIFFRTLEFHIQIESTRIHARYDKERALDLGDLRQKAGWLFRLVPYLMDLDWIIGYLELEPPARVRVAQAWAERFTAWGVLPVAQLLTAERKGILLGIESDPAGERELCWSGQGAYRDRFDTPAPESSLAWLRGALARLGLPEPPSPAVFGQEWFHRWISQPLSEALECGEVLGDAGSLRRAEAALYRRDHEAERFAEILVSDENSMRQSAAVALLAAPLMRSLRFQSTGEVNGYAVQSARVMLRDACLSLYVLLDAAGIARLALFADRGTLYSRRAGPPDPWQLNGSTDAADLAFRLRRSNYLFPGLAALPAVSQEETARLRESFRSPNPRQVPRPLPGERVAFGNKASPGRAVGVALFGTEGRAPADFDGAVLVSATVRPEDNTFLYHARGIVSTGGGILSHAGLIATQFRKPALVVSGSWQRALDGALLMRYCTLEYREEERRVGGFDVRIRRDIHEREYCLGEGDLVVLEADQGLLRVLGQDLEALSLHDGLRLFNAAAAQLTHADDEPEILRLRGLRLREFYQLKKLLGRIANPALACHAGYELILGETAMRDSGSRREQSQLLALILANPRVGGTVRGYLAEVARQLQQRCEARMQRAWQLIPAAGSLGEALALRLEALRLRLALQSVRVPLQDCGVALPEVYAHETTALDLLVRRRLEELRGAWAGQARRCAGEPEQFPRLRHLLRRIERSDELLDSCGDDRAGEAGLAGRLKAEDEAACRAAANRLVVGPEDGGFELYPLIGWKAANLAEVARLGGRSLVPPWVVVTHRAFEWVLDMPVESAEPGIARKPIPLRGAIEQILAQADLAYAQKSAMIRGLWDRVRLPQELVEEVTAAYRRLARDLPAGHAGFEDAHQPYVAIRSSALEEDAEAAARAGEFDTFLFISGEKPLLDFLRRAWSGLWTERAIHNRAVLGGGNGRAGGGVILQRIVWSRVSGVLQTVNVADGEFREMLINVGLGLGEGIVSGTVAADQVAVSKAEDLENSPLRFRYVTADKREQVVFNRRAGFGTCRNECLYHQRLRPALEYVELLELVRTAARLEEAYGYPLDIEFGIEGTQLWILQARPVVLFQSVLQETRGSHPLARALKSKAQEG